MATKAPTKKDELKARNAVDEKHKSSVLGNYDKKLAIAKKARDYAGGEYFQKMVTAAKSRVNGAYKRLADLMKEKPSKLETKADLSEHSKAMSELKNEVSELDILTHTVRRDCLELETFVNQFTDAPLFEKEMTEIARWNHEKMRVEIKKRDS